MRSRPSSWTNTLAKLGFRRVRRPLKAPGASGRRSRFESLEARQMLSITVNTLVDENDGIGVGGVSLREAIASSGSYGNEVDFDPSLSGGTITLTEGALSVASNVSIAGPGAGDLTIDANGLSRIMGIWGSTTTVTISGLTLTGGVSTGGGGAIYNQGNLTLDSVEVVGNSTDTSGGGVAVQSGGKLTISNSAFEQNRATGAGGIGGAIGLFFSAADALTIENSTFAGNTAVGGGAIRIHSTAVGSVPVGRIVNSTFSGNAASDFGGAIAVTNAAGATAPVTIVNSTIADNTARYGGGLWIDNANGVVVALHNTIVAENVATVFPNYRDAYGSVNGQSTFNLIGLGYTGLGISDGAGGNQIGSVTPIDPLLAPLADNGGPTKTHALLVGSPAVDKGSESKATAAGLTLDQRGFGRVVDIPGVANGIGGGVDVGAVEFGISALLDAEGALVIDDTDAELDEIVLGVALVAERLVVTLNGQPTPYEAGDITSIEVIGGAGDDVLDLSGVSPSVLGNLEAVTIDGGDGNDAITGTMGGDRIIGGDGQNTLVGGLGDDVYVIDEYFSMLGSSHTIDDEDGFDTLDFSRWFGAHGASVDLAAAAGVSQYVDVHDNARLIFAEAGQLEAVIGTHTYDHIHGNAADNWLVGGGGSDFLYGYAGDDVLDGGAGNDFLEGGDGDDDIRSGDGVDSVAGSTGSDVTDASAADLLPPAFGNLGTIKVRKDQVRAVRLVASDQDSTFGEWNYERYLLPGQTEYPQWLSDIGDDGVLRWTPDIRGYSDPGTYQVGVKITDPSDLSDTQIVTIEVEDYNDSAPRSERYTWWFDDSTPPDMETGSAAYWFHNYGQVSPTYVSSDIIFTELASEPFFMPGYRDIPDSTTLHIQLNPYVAERAGAFDFDTQTTNSALKYTLVDGPGSVTSSGRYTWNVGIDDAGKTHRLVFEIEDTGSDDDGPPRKHQDFLLVKVGKWVPDEYDWYRYYAPPVAIDRDYAVHVGESFEGEIAAGYRLNGVYAPDFYEYPDQYVPENSIGAVFALGSPGHGTVELLDGDASLPRGQFRYTPEPGFRGVDSFTYTIEHYADWPSDPDPNVPDWVTSNTATVYIYVGPEWEIDADTYVADAIEEDPPGARLVWNRDDDNGNGVEDYLEIDGPIQDEDDLIPLDLSTWIREGRNPIDLLFHLDIYGAHRVWTTADKAQEIVDENQFSTDEMPATVWLEGIGPIGDLVISKFNTSNLAQSPWPQLARWPSQLIGPNEEGPIAEDKNRTSAFTIDVDIDSDNNDAFAAPEGSSWEEFLEDNSYGLGKLIMLDNPTRPVTPIELKLQAGLDPNDPTLRVRIDWADITSAGTVHLWKRSVADDERNLGPIEDGGDKIFPSSTYALSDLDYNPTSGLVVVYAEGVGENPEIKTLVGVDQRGKPDERIRATIVVNGHDIAFDEVKYLVANEDSFFYHLQTRPEVRNALASRGVYEHDDMPQFSLKPLSPQELLNLGVPGDVATLLGAGSGIPGFDADLYQDFITGENQYVLAFAGTDADSIADWINNIKQGLGYPAEQYEKAMEIGFRLRNFAPGIPLGHLVTTGHSLGGGLASAAAVASGIPAYTFNAAGLHANTLNEQLYPDSTARYNNAADGILAYYVDWDILSLFQDHYSVTVAGVTIDPPSAVGLRVQGDGPHDTELTIAEALGSELGQLYFAIQCHLNPAVLFSLLDEYGVYQ